MSRIAPKPVISQIIRKWSIEPGLTFAVAEDVDGRLWVEESCPVGTHYWTVEQAAQLATGCRSERALQEAVSLACERRSLDHMPTLPAFDGELESAIAAAPGRRRRIAVRSNRPLTHA
jgi:hypothetical protein